MTTLSHLRKAARTLPETAMESVRAGTVAFITNEKRFAAADNDWVELHLPPDDVEKVLAVHPRAERMADAGVRVRLADINGQQLNHWLRRAWRAKARAPLVTQATAADSAVPGEVGDLPKAIGRPATRALVAAGITTLDLVAERSEAELKRLHGMGPKAIRILSEALSATGRQFRT